MMAASGESSIFSHPSAEDNEIDAARSSPEQGEFDPVEDWEPLDLPEMENGVWKHVYENGRRFHLYKHGRYPIPNDDVEQNREELKHAMLLELTVSEPDLARVPIQAAFALHNESLWLLGKTTIYYTRLTALSSYLLQERRAALRTNRQST